jgi:hypothetical protein
VKQNTTQAAFAVTIFALDRHNQVRIQLAIVSKNSYAEVLHEAIGLGQRFLKNDKDISRVEVHEELAVINPASKPLVVLTQDDLPDEKTIEPDKSSSWSASFARGIHRLLGR